MVLRQKLVVSDGAYGHIIDHGLPGLKQEPEIVLCNSEAKEFQKDLYRRYANGFWSVGHRGMVFANSFYAESLIDGGSTDYTSEKIYQQYTWEQQRLVQAAIQNSSATRRQAQSLYYGVKMAPSGDCYQIGDKNPDVHDLQVWQAKHLVKNFGLEFALFETNPEIGDPIKIIREAGKRNVNVVIGLYVDAEAKQKDGREIGEVIKELVSHKNTNFYGALINCCPPEAIPKALASCRKFGVLEYLIGAYPNTANAETFDLQHQALANGDSSVLLQVSPTQKSVNTVIANAHLFQPKHGSVLVGGCCGHGPDEICQICRGVV